MMPDVPVLLLIPPLTQLNTPYPSTAYLTGFLRAHGYTAAQADVGIEMVLALFSRVGLSRVFEEIKRMAGPPRGEVRQMLVLERDYLDSIEPVIAFLQGQDATLAPLICRGRFLPQGPRFAHASFSKTGSTIDDARHLATLYLEDLTDLIRETVAPHFALSRYAEHVGTSATSFETVARALSEPLHFTDELMLEAVWRHVESINPLLVGLTVPFPGNLYGAFRIAQSLKNRLPSIKIALGGGYANTELRRLQDPRVFDYLDYVTLDDGERPLLCLVEHLMRKRNESDLCRTFMRTNGRVRFQDGCREPDFSMAELSAPTYTGLPLSRYLSILDTLNPMHRLWSDGHWNKLTVAHGCYWKQCTFCDVELDYIRRYEATPSEILADRIEALIAETGRRGFHFVDEAAPPAGLKALALTLLERGVAIAWWGNVRFESAFTPDLCRLLAASGCIAVSAGLEAASNRLLDAMKKGVTVEQAARVSAAFKAAGILMHAYLMYGLPGETIAETVESLERVRQLFEEGLLQSAFWHKFTATAHSPIGLAPEVHGIRITGPPFGGFAENDRTHHDPIGETPEWLGVGLNNALFAYKNGKGFRNDVRGWFAQPVPRPRVPRDWIAQALDGMPRTDDPAAERRLVWIGGQPIMEPAGRDRRRVILPSRTEDRIVHLQPAEAEWLVNCLQAATPTREKHGDGYPSLQNIQGSSRFEGPGSFDALLRSAAWKKTRDAGLLLI